MAETYQLKHTGEQIDALLDKAGTAVQPKDIPADIATQRELSDLAQTTDEKLSDLEQTTDAKLTELSQGTSGYLFSQSGYISIAGRELESTSYFRTDYLIIDRTCAVRVIGGDVGVSANLLSFFDKDKNYISGFGGCDIAEVAVEDIPSNAYYIRASVWSPKKKTIIVEGVSLLGLSAELAKVKNEIPTDYLTSEDEREINAKIDGYFDMASENLYSGKYEEGFINSVNGALQTASSLPNAFVSAPIDVYEGMVYCISGRPENIGVRCLDKGGNPIKVLSASNGVEISSWYIPSADGTGFVQNGQFRVPSGAVSFQFGITLYSELTEELNKIVVEKVGESYNPSFVPSAFEGYNSGTPILKDEYAPQVVNTKMSLPLEGKTLAFIGDSAIQVGNMEMTAMCAKFLGAKTHYNFAQGGFCWTNILENGQHKNCCKVLVDRLIESGVQPDVIVFQIGGNDLGLSNYGTLASAFAEYNYKPLAQNTSVYGSIRYNLQRTMEAFPNARIIVGTVFQRRGNDASQISVPLREVCAKLAIPVMDGNIYSGISQYAELLSPVYSDNPNGSNGGSRDYPQYMWVESDGTIVSKESKSASATKVYGKYTYDGTHRTIKGDEHIAEWIASQIASICAFVE